jgi:hypothetical protein
MVVFLLSFSKQTCHKPIAVCLYTLHNNYVKSSQFMDPIMLTTIIILETVVQAGYGLSFSALFCGLQCSLGALLIYLPMLTMPSHGSLWTKLSFTNLTRSFYLPSKPNCFPSLTNSAYHMKSANKSLVLPFKSLDLI